MIEEITSPQNRIVKLATSLKRKKYRDETGLFAIEGVRLAEEVLKSDWQIDFCIYSSELLKNLRGFSLIEVLERRGCPLYQVDKTIYSKVSDTKEPQGIFLAVEKRVHDFADILERGKRPMIFVLDGVRDPGNVGTIIRTADAAGCDGVVLFQGCADLFSGKVTRSTMGSIFHLPVIEAVDALDLLRILRMNDIVMRVTALDDMAKPYFDVDYTQATAVFFGSEGFGVSSVVLEGADERIFIPMAGQVESLNVATAAAIISYEGLRQRMLIKSCDL